MKFVVIFILSSLLSVQRIIAQKVYTRDELERVMNPSVLEKADLLLRFDSTEINAGVISEDDKPITFSFRCRNVSGKRVVITRINTTCGCTDAQVDNLVIQPGGEANIKVVFNPFGHPGKAFLRTFVYSDFSEKEPIAALTVNAEVKPSEKLWKDYRYTLGTLKLRNITADLRQVEIGKKKSLKIACANSGSRPLKVAPMNGFLPDFISLRTEPEILSPSEEGVLVIEYNGKMPKEISGKKNYKVILDGLDVRPSQRTITVSLEFMK